MTGKQHSAVTVIVADDHPLFRVALRLGVRSLLPSAEVIEVDSFDSLRAAAARYPTSNLVLLDLMMPGAQGLSALEFLRSEFPTLRVAVISSVSQPSWLRMIRTLGACAFVHKSASPELMQSILGRVLDGGEYWPEAERSSPKPALATPPVATADERFGLLSRQELRIVLHIKQGRLNKQIAGDLQISESTVKTHISAILRKLGLNTRTQVALLAERLLSVPSGS